MAAPAQADERDVRSHILLRDIPLDPRYRATLRIYGIDGVTESVTPEATKQIGPISFAIVYYAQLPLHAPCRETPCNSNDPAHATIDLNALLAGVEGPVTLAISSWPALPPHRLWGIVSITNNDSQHVTVIRPQ